MIFLFGERIKRETNPVGTRFCPVCTGDRTFNHILETNYFCLFGIRLLPLEKVSDYHQCANCENAFQSASLEAESLPTHVELTRSVIAYVFVGYGMQEHLGLAADIAKKVTGFDVKEDDMRSRMREFAAGRVDLFVLIKSQANVLNLRGKQQIIEAAFLVTHACCEIQYEDRLRINMVATAMDISIAFVNATIEQIRRQGCYGVRRLLPTQTQV